MEHIFYNLLKKIKNSFVFPLYALKLKGKTKEK